MQVWEGFTQGESTWARVPIRDWGADPVGFAALKLGFTVDAAQERALRGGRRGIVNCTRQWGKSTVMAAKAVHRAYTRGGGLVLVMSPSARQSGEFLRKAEEFVRRLGIRPRGDGDNALSIVFPNGSRIVGLPGSERTLRGFSNVSLMLFDEAARAPDELYRAMRPALEEWERGGAEWERIRVTGEECGRISKRFLEEERAKGEQWYRQEYGCEFLDHEGAVFPAGLIEGAFGEDFEPLATDQHG